MARSGNQRSPVRASTRQYLTLKRLSVDELPSHPELSASQTEQRVTLVNFLDSLLTEIEEVDFDAGFSSHGKWHPESMNIHMPVLQNQTSADAPLDGAKSASNIYKDTNLVPVSVNQKMKKEGRSIWCARTSYHLERDVKYSELDKLLSQDHSLNEARYTPSVYDANELLTWDAKDISDAMLTIGSRHSLERVQLSIFEMFHKMPEIGGLNFLEDRVFHVLVMTAHTSYRMGYSSEESNSSKIPQSFTVQLPVDFGSLNQAPIIKKRSHVQKKGSSQRYQFPSDGLSGAALPTSLQNKKMGNKLIQGTYVSLERVRKAPKVLYFDEKDAAGVQSAEGVYHHRWDMMTLSDAGGITRLAPQRQKQKEILDAIATDVEYVIKYVAGQRQSAVNDSHDKRLSR